jgi:phosphoglycolate phosphatase
VVFDWNGTLVDDVDRAIVATNVTLERHGRPPVDAAGFATAFRLPLIDFFAELGVAPADLHTAEIEWNTAMAGQRPRLAMGCGEVLAACEAAGLAVGVLSGAAASVVHRDAEILGIAKRLDFVIGSARSKSRELQRLRESREIVAYVGDTEFDVEAAREAGITSVALSSGYRPHNATVAAAPDVHVPSLEALSAMIDGLLSSRQHTETRT